MTDNADRFETLTSRLRCGDHLALLGSDVDKRLLDDLHTLLREAASEIDGLQSLLADRDGWCDHLASRESALLLAVPRPFRRFIDRRAQQIHRGMYA